MNFIKTLPGRKHLCLEEGNHSAWLHEILEPHVEEIVVLLQRSSKGPKDDRIDAFDLAEKMRIGAIEKRVYKGASEFAVLGELSKGYRVLKQDSVRAQSRIKSLFRSRGISTSGKKIYSLASRDAARSEKTSHVPCTQDRPRHGRPTRGSNASDSGHSISLREQAFILGLHRASGGNAQLLGLAASTRRQMDSCKDHADPRPQSRLQPRTHS